MNNNFLQYFDIILAKEAYKNGENITELLREQKKLDVNTPEIIEASYDLQSGSYINYVNTHRSQATLFCSEVASILDPYTKLYSTLLDIGTGELTTLSLVMDLLKSKPEKIYAFDISWSRISDGLSFARKHMGESFSRLNPFVCNIQSICFPDKSIEITTSSHALEPNGGKLSELLIEIFRITSERVILIEPCYEINSNEGKEWMDKLGYIKNIEQTVINLGGSILDKINIKNNWNSLNPAVCFVIKPPEIIKSQQFLNNSIYTVPGTNYPLSVIDNFYYSNDTGLCFPTIRSIPIFRLNSAILASSLSK